MDYNVKSSQVEEAHERIKASYAGIISRKMTVPPYEGRMHFEIMYFDDNEKDWHIGYGSFVLEYVQTWLDEEFESTYKRLDEAITDLISRAEAAEARVRELEKLLSAVQNMENFHPDETGFFVFTKKNADDITEKLLAAEARAEKAETERDEALEILHSYRHIYGEMPPEQLSKLVEAHRDGRCVVLPCKLYDKVFFIENGCVKETEVDSFHNWTSGHWKISTHTDRMFDHWKGYEIDFSGIGKTIFLTREAAEAALKGEENG